MCSQGGEIKDMKFFAKWIPFGVQVVLYFFMATAIHEQFHNLASRTLGLDGYVKFSLWGVSYFYYAQGVAPTFTQDLIVRLAGGLGTALLFGLLWGFSHWQGMYSEWEIDTSFIFGVITIFQVIYAMCEPLSTLWAWSQLVGILFGIGLCSYLYGIKLMRWLYLIPEKSGGPNG